MSAAAVDKTGLQYWADLDPNGFGGLSLRTTLDVPVIVRVNGYALGGGMEMVLGADIVVAAESAQFGLTEPRVGRLALDGGISQLVRKIPYTQAMGLLLTGRRAPATEMAALGLVNEVVPAAELDAAVDRWVQQILACAPTSVRAVKQMVTQTMHLSAQDARRVRLPALMEALDSSDSAEGVLAFQEKRRPVWPGK
jgi:crotonobetainyl-CoA hydratase